MSSNLRLETDMKNRNFVEGFFLGINDSISANIF